MQYAGRSPDNVSPAALNRRQREVAILIATGCTNGDIARELSLAPGTVSLYVQQIRWRLGATKRAQIAIWAVRHGLYPRPE